MRQRQPATGLAETAARAGSRGWPVGGWAGGDPLKAGPGWQALHCAMAEGAERRIYFYFILFFAFLWKSFHAHE